MNLVNIEDPNLVTTEVNSNLDYLDDIRNYDGVLAFDFDTKENAKFGYEVMDDNSLKISYARRLLSALFFSSEIGRNKKSKKHTFFAYDCAAECAYHLNERFTNESGFWLYRAMVAKGRGAKLVVTLPRRSTIAFNSYVSAAKSGTMLLNLIQNSKFDVGALIGVSVKSIYSETREFLKRASRLKTRHKIPNDYAGVILLESIRTNGNL